MHSRSPVNRLYLMKDKWLKKENKVWGYCAHGDAVWEFAARLLVIY